jgi:hypothetical protein
MLSVEGKWLIHYVGTVCSFKKGDEVLNVAWDETSMICAVAKSVPNGCVVKLESLRGEHEGEADHSIAAGWSHIDLERLCMICRCL